MVKVNRCLGRNFFRSILLFAIISCILLSTPAFSEEATLTQAEKDYAQADTLLKSQNFSEAKALFLSASENTSDSELAMKSLARAGRCEIRSGNLTAADQLLDKLKNDYSTQPELNENIYYFGHSYWNERKFDKAKEVYQLVFDKSNGSDLEFKSLAKIICCQIRLSDYSSADQMIDEIINNYSQHADLNTALAGFAYQYQEQKEFDKAKEYYQFVLQNSSDVELAYKGQLGVMQCEKELGNYAGALAAFEELWTNHSSAKGFVEKATHVCGDILSFEAPDTVLPYVDRALEVAEDIKTVMMLLQFKAKCHIDLGQSEQAQAVSQQIELYSDKEYYPGVQLALACVYRNNGQYEKAMEIYNNVLQSSTDDTKKIDAHAGVAAVAVLRDNDSDVTAAIEALRTNFAGHEMLAWAVFVIGEEYYKKVSQMENKGLKIESEECFQKAITVWEKVRSIESTTIYPAHAWYFSGFAYKKMGNYTKTIEYYQEVVDRWPDYQYAWSAQCMIGECYEKLITQGILSEGETEPLIEQAYKLVIENYGDSSLAGHACLKLAEMNLKKGLKLEAAGYYEQFLTVAPNDSRVKGVKAKLGKLDGVTK